jgi:hypothetical protein
VSLNNERIIEDEESFAVDDGNIEDEFKEVIGKQVLREEFPSSLIKNLDTGEVTHVNTYLKSSNVKCPKTIKSKIN